MEESAPKRRRVSPRTSAGGPSTATPESASPSKPRQKRPSFASPTKASLARYNPQILERRRSASPSKPVSPSRSVNLRPRSRRASDAASEQSLSQLLTEQIMSTAGSVAASEPDRGEAHVEAAPGLGSSARKPRGGILAAPRRSPAKPVPRPLPPPAPDGEDELNPFIGKTIRRSPNTGLPLPLPPEPELPPVVEDPISSTPPRGIHSSPSRWRDRTKPKKSSPLKPRDERPTEKSSKKSGLAPPSFERPAERGTQPLQDLPLDARSNRARNVLALDTNKAKKRQRDALRDEISELRRDLDVANRENERIRLMQSAGRVLASNNEDEVLDVVRQCLVSADEPARPAQSQQLVKAALNPMALLPFTQLAPVAHIADKDIIDTKNIKSHYPVALTAEEELPYLQVFSPFSITSSIAILPPAPNNALRQRRSITLRSKDMPGLFTARVAMVVNAMNLAVLDLSVEALEPAAKHELGPFTEKICSGDCNRSMQRNVGILSWAMGEWYRVALQRATFWTRLERELASKDGLLETAREMWTRKKDGEKEEKAAPSCSRADLIRLMGQQSYEIKVPSVDDSAESSVRLEWKIGFDWTGEAQSRMSVMTGVPGKWRAADRRGIFGNLSTLFECLVEGGEEPDVAVRTLVALLAGERV